MYFAVVFAKKVMVEQIYRDAFLVPYLKIFVIHERFYDIYHNIYIGNVYVYQFSSYEKE